MFWQTQRRIGAHHRSQDLFKALRPAAQQIKRDVAQPWTAGNPQHRVGQDCVLAKQMPVRLCIAPKRVRTLLGNDFGQDAGQQYLTYPDC